MGLMRRRLVAAGAAALAVLIGVAVYARLSSTSVLNSDSANILLAGAEMLHGNLLLHGWFASDVSFYSTEIPQYAALTAIFGPHAHTAHIAAGMTYTLVFFLAALLARAGASSPGQALTRSLIAAGIMLAPSLGVGVFALDLSVGHIGTSVPLLLTWLLLDWTERTGRQRWWVPVATAVLLAWVLIADPIVLIVGIGPLAIAGLVRFWLAVRGGSAPRAAWYPMSLTMAAVAGYVLATCVEVLLHALGGYTLHGLPFHLLPPDALLGNSQAAWKLLDVYGASFAGSSGVPLVLAFLHLASVAVVAAALVIAVWRFARLALVEQVLAVAIVLNVALFALTNASTLAANEVAIVVPFGAVLAARLLPGTARLLPGTLHSGTLPSTAARRLWRAQAGLLAAGVLVLGGYAAGLGYELTQPAQPMTNTGLASWLVAHHFRYGLSGYWTSSSVTVASGGRAEVRALLQYTLRRDLWMSDVRWYDPKYHYANFVVLDGAPGFYHHWEPAGLIGKYFGTPAKVYRSGLYTIEVWDRNLLTDIP